MNNIIKFVAKSKKYQGGGDMCKILKKIKNKNPYELFNEYEISMNPPIDILNLLQKIGIQVIKRDFADIEKIMEVEEGSVLGAAFSNNEDLAIFYRAKDTLHRKKFTIAHELAHCCLHCPNDETNHIEYRLKPYTNVSKEILKKEREANIFAGELLIPEESLSKIYHKMIIPTLSDLAEIFDVSTSVMAARLDYLKLPYFKDRTIEEMIV